MNTDHPAAIAQSWGPRLKAHWLVKTVGITLFITVFFIGYLHLLKNPVRPVTVMPGTFLDGWIVFQPWTLPVYATLWLYVIIPPVTLGRLRELLKYGITAAIVAASGLAVFLVWPTVIVRPEIDWSQYPAFEFLQTVDAAGNACPSLHAAFAVFTALRLDRILRGLEQWACVSRALNAAWCLAILYSTLATKQHVAIDLVAGVALGGVGAQIWPGLGWRPDNRGRPVKAV